MVEDAAELFARLLERGLPERVQVLNFGGSETVDRYSFAVEAARALGRAFRKCWRSASLPCRISSSVNGIAPCTPWISFMNSMRALSVFAVTMPPPALKPHCNQKIIPRWLIN